MRSHHAAVKKAGHEFSPFVMETSGYVDAHASKVIQVLANALHPWQRPFFRAEFYRSLSVNLMRQKIRAVEAAVQKHRKFAFSTDPP